MFLDTSRWASCKRIPANVPLCGGAGDDYRGCSGDGGGGVHAAHAHGAGRTRDSHAANSVPCGEDTRHGIAQGGANTQSGHRSHGGAAYAGTSHLLISYESPPRRTACVQPLLSAIWSEVRIASAIDKRLVGPRSCIRHAESACIRHAESAATRSSRVLATERPAAASTAPLTTASHTTDSLRLPSEFRYNSTSSSMCWRRC